MLDISSLTVSPILPAMLLLNAVVLSTHPAVNGKTEPESP